MYSIKNMLLMTIIFSMLGLWTCFRLLRYPTATRWWWGVLAIFGANILGGLFQLFYGARSWMFLIPTAAILLGVLALRRDRRAHKNARRHHTAEQKAAQTCHRNDPRWS